MVISSACYLARYWDFAAVCTSKPVARRKVRGDCKMNVSPKWTEFQKSVAAIHFVILSEAKADGFARDVPSSLASLKMTSPNIFARIDETPAEPLR